LPDSFDGAIAVRLVATDASGNTIEYVMDPAYVSAPDLMDVVPPARVAAAPDGVRLIWRVPASLPGAPTVYRRGLHTDWSALGPPSAGTPGEVLFTDRTASGGRRHAYALGFESGGRRLLAGATWVDVPGASLALFGILPNPNRGDLRVSFSLASAAPARLELFDVTGRLRRRLEVGPLGPGEHSVDLGAGLDVGPGIYWVRLEQAGATVQRRASVIR
jgi:hypothetical protein